MVLVIERLFLDRGGKYCICCSNILLIFSKKMLNHFNRNNVGSPLRPCQLKQRIIEINLFGVEALINIHSNWRPSLFLQSVNYKRFYNNSSLLQFLLCGMPWPETDLDLTWPRIHFGTTCSQRLCGNYYATKIIKN